MILFKFFNFFMLLLQSLSSKRELYKLRYIQDRLIFFPHILTSSLHMSVETPRSPFSSGGNNNPGSCLCSVSGGFGTSPACSPSPCTSHSFEFPSKNSANKKRNNEEQQQQQQYDDSSGFSSYFSVIKNDSMTRSLQSDPTAQDKDSCSPNSLDAKKRPAKLEFSLNLPHPNVRPGLQTPNSAKSAKSFSEALRLGPRPPLRSASSAMSMHLHFRSPSLPISTVGSRNELPDSVEAITSQNLANMLSKDVSFHHNNNISTATTNDKLLNEKSHFPPTNSLETLVDSLSPSPDSLTSEEFESCESTQQDPSSQSLDDQFPDDVLLIDVRPYAQYAMSHIQHAISICVPSTLLKRPTFGVDKFINCMIPDQRQHLSDIGKYRQIILYDQGTLSFPNANGTSLFYTLLKFHRCPDVIGKVCYLGGGYNSFESQQPFLIEKNCAKSDLSSLEDFSGVVDLNGTSSNGTMLSTLSIAPVLTGFSLPETSTKDGPLAAFTSQIPLTSSFQHDTMPITLPDGLTTSVLKTFFPNWLQQIAGLDGPNIIAGRFDDIEKAEKIRLRAALSKEQAFGMVKSSSNGGGGIKYSISAGLELGAKNRYHNIFPYDHTRVILNSPDGGDYINASYISSGFSTKKYIATQGPLPDTFQDFWKMIWDHEIPVILMLTAEFEGGIVKCHSYWGNSHIGKINVVQVEEKTEPLSAATGSNIITIRKFELYHDNYPSKIRKVVQIQYTDWPDLGAPATPNDLISLCRLKEKYLNESRLFLADEPISLVHCSAGCGRTGTFCSVDTVIDILRNKSKDSSDKDIVFDVVHEFRSQRLSMVQSLRQFSLCYETIILWFFQNMTNQ